MGSRVRIAAAASLVACGLLAGGAGASLAFADPALTGGDSGDKHTNGSVGNGPADKPKPDPDERKTPPGGDGKGDQPGTDPVDPKAEDDKKDGDNGKGDGKDGGADNGSNGDKNNGGNGVGNPGKGNCGNSGSNGMLVAAAGAATAIPTIRPPRSPPPFRPKKSRHHLKNPVSATTRTRITARRVAVAMAAESGSAPGPGGGGGADRPRCRPADHTCRRRCSCRPS
jgi:hypothetical protein